ncbi:hypothetical protein Rmf_24580 [Roseomonas fluvialis]|uniref:Uncharacterized protein n=2 Tax=Roseomonas fluvialis TaxID=1750527 RepID=A0ABN6P4H9_9PROT|nr:hypothetical protein Rmf_24580 [Roseomonas fluvialis]
MRAIGREDDAKILPVLDRDTAGLPGTPDITQSILTKISASDVFVADVSIIFQGTTRPTPNPNVLIELGYAIAELGWDNVILVMNAAFGGPELLPFDLRGRRVAVYDATENGDRKESQGLLQGRLEAFLRTSLKDGASANLPTGSSGNLWWGKWNFSSGSAGGYLFIREVGPCGFLFDLDVVHGAHNGSVTAYARIVSNDLAYCRLANGDTGNDGELVFKRSLVGSNRIIEIEETALCSFYHGMRATFSGKYSRDRAPWFDIGLINELELSRLYNITGSHFDKLLDCTSDIGSSENLDHELNAQVITGGVAGLYTFMESIVMLNNAGEMWVAYLNDSKVYYFTNVPSFKTTLPKTIEAWRGRFEAAEVIFCASAEVTPPHRR